MHRRELGKPLKGRYFAGPDDFGRVFDDLRLVAPMTLWMTYRLPDDLRKWTIPPGNALSSARHRDGRQPGKLFRME